MKRQHLAPDTVVRSRTLRREAGEPERRLWLTLREALPETRFRRQVTFGPYHTDFCSHDTKLIVEVDGDDHAMKTESDAARTRFLNDEGYHMIRFANSDVMTNGDAVVASIAAAVADMRKGRP